MFAYALRYAEHEIPHGSVRRRMALYRPASSRAHGTRTPQAPRLEGDPRRRLLRAKERLPVAAFAPRVPALEDRLRLVQEVAHRWDLGTPERRAARASTVPSWQGPTPQRGHRGFSVGQDLGSGRPRARFRPRKESERKKAPFARRHRGLGALKAKVHSARVPDQDGIRLLLESARTRLSRLKHLWVDAGYQGRGKRWAEEVSGVSVKVVRKPQKPIPQKVAKTWAEEWAKEGKEVDWQRLMPPKGFRVLPRRWVVERTFAWISHNRRMAKDYERLCATGEAFIYAAMTRLMVRRLARA